MLEKINKKVVIQTAVLLSGFFAFILQLGDSQDKNELSLLSNLNNPIGSIEFAFASDGGGCAGGCSGGSSDSGNYAPADSGVGIIYQ